MRDNGVIALFWILFHTVRDAYDTPRAWQALIVAIVVLVLLPVALIVGLVLLFVY